MNVYHIVLVCVVCLIFAINSESFELFHSVSSMCTHSRHRIDNVWHHLLYNVFSANAIFFCFCAKQKIDIP